MSTDRDERAKEPSKYHVFCEFCQCVVDPLFHGMHTNEEWTRKMTVELMKLNKKLERQDGGT